MSSPVPDAVAAMVLSNVQRLFRTLKESKSWLRRPLAWLLLDGAPLAHSAAFSFDSAKTLKTYTTDHHETLGSVALLLATKRPKDADRLPRASLSDPMSTAIAFVQHRCGRTPSGARMETLRRNVSIKELWEEYRAQLSPGHRPLGRQTFAGLLHSMHVRMDKHTQRDAFSCYYCRLVAQWTQSGQGIPQDQQVA